MIVIAIFCVQTFFVQHAFTQTVSTNANINNGIPSAFGSVGHGQASFAAANMNPALAGQMITGGIPGTAFSSMGPQGLNMAQNQMGALNIAQNQMGALNIAQNQMGALNMAQNQMGIAAAIAANSQANGFASNYGGSGSGDVVVAGELPVAGTTAISGQVPLSGKVQFTGTLPAGGIVTISGQCGCGLNNGQYNAPFNAQPIYNNKPYAY